MGVWFSFDNLLTIRRIVIDFRLIYIKSYIDINNDTNLHIIVLVVALLLDLLTTCTHYTNYTLLYCINFWCLVSVS